MTQRSWAAFAMRVAEQDMGSLGDVFDVAKKLTTKLMSVLPWVLDGAAIQGFALRAPLLCAVVQMIN